MLREIQQYRAFGPDRATKERVIDILCTGRGLVESPRWHDGRLWFSDWTAGEILAIDAVGAVEVMVRHESLPLCFDFLPDGRLIVVSAAQRALLTPDEDGGLETFTDLRPLSTFGFNDIVIDGRGTAYVNSPNFDFAAGPPAGGMQPGFVAAIHPDGTAEVVSDDIAFPNGMAVTADSQTLIVADSYRHQLVGFSIEPGGGLSGRRVWADLGDAAPDGICLDAAGACWYADVPHQRCVRVAEGGDVLQTVALDRGGFACMLGGPAGTDLYVVAAHWPGMAALQDHTEWDGQVIRTAVTVPAAGWPGNSSR